MGDEDWRPLGIVISKLCPQTGFVYFHLYCQQCIDPVEGARWVQGATGLCTWDDNGEPLGQVLMAQINVDKLKNR